MNRMKTTNSSARRLPTVENLESRLLLTAAALEGLSTPVSGATLDIGNNAVVVSNGGDPGLAEQAIQQYIENGSGAVINDSGSVISNYVATSGLGIAYADGSDSGQIVIEPSLDDADLNGTVNMHDLQDVIGNFGDTNSTLYNDDLHSLLAATPATKPARHLVFKETSVANGKAGSDLSSIIVKIENAQNQVVTSATKTITLSVASGPSDTIHGTVSVAAVNGKAIFSHVKLDTAGTYTLTASDDKDTSATSGSFTIKHAAAAQLAFASMIQPVGVDTTISPPLVVDVEDAFGNPCTGSTIAVTLGIKNEGGVIPESASADSSSVLQGTLKIHAIAGQATFSDISINTSGNIELKATHGSLTKGFSNTFVVGGLSA